MIVHMNALNSIVNQMLYEIDINTKIGTKQLK